MVAHGKPAAVGAAMGMHAPLRNAGILPASAQGPPAHPQHPRRKTNASLTPQDSSLKTQDPPPPRDPRPQPSESPGRSLKMVAPWQAGRSRRRHGYARPPLPA